jgi:hypothetical protein
MERKSQRKKYTTLKIFQKQILIKMLKEKLILAQDIIKHMMTMMMNLKGEELNVNNNELFDSYISFELNL